MHGNGQLSNSSSAIGNPMVRYSAKEGSGDNPRQISPLIMSHISEKHLKIEVQQNVHQQRGLEAQNVDQPFTPSMIRRSIGSRSAVKNMPEQLSFLDKAATANTKIEGASFDVRNPLGNNSNAPLVTTVNMKKMQAAKLTQKHLMQTRYTNGTDPSTLPKRTGIPL